MDFNSLLIFWSGFPNTFVGSFGHCKFSVQRYEAVYQIFCRLGDYYMEISSFLLLLFFGSFCEGFILSFLVLGLCSVVSC